MPEKQKIKKNKEKTIKTLEKTTRTGKKKSSKANLERLEYQIK